MPINFIKIYGERNSGTNFIEQLIKKNCLNINIFSSNYKGGTGWKHGYPDIKYFNEIDNTLYVFIIRDLEKWLKSMYYQPYSYQRPENIYNFINYKLKMKDERLDHDVNINPEEKDNIFNLRYKKLQKYLEFSELVSNFIFINLEDIQINPKKFILFLNSQYQINIHKCFDSIPNHTKNNLPGRSRIWNIQMPYNLIKSKEDIEHENFIKSLKDNYFYK